MERSGARLACFGKPLVGTLTLAVLLSFPFTEAYPTYRDLVPSHSVPCPPHRLSECDGGPTCNGLGHISCKGGSVKAADGEFLNKFGKAFAANGHQWTRDLCEADSDGDGVSNGVELGDPCCIWNEGMPSPVDDSYVLSHPGDPRDAGASRNALPSAGACAALADSSPEAGSVTEELVDAMYDPGEDRISLNYMTREHRLLPNETIYSRFYFKLPRNESVYAVGALPHIDNVVRTHHFVLYLCTRPISAYTHKPQGAANNPTSVEDNGGVPESCQQTIFIWAPGVGSLKLPNDTAFELGANTPYKTLFLEVHYNNVDGVSNETDASGITIYATSQPRAKSAGWLWTGSQLTVGTIPPGVPQYFSNQQCTVVLRPQCESIEVVGFVPHAHFLGTAVWAEQYRPNATGEPVLVGDLGGTFDFSYENQAMRYLEPRVVKSGDVISTTCMYNATDKSEPTTGGLASQQEMCIALLLYTEKDCVRSNLCHGVPVSGRWPADVDLEAPGASASVVPITTLPDFAALASTGSVACNPAAAATMAPTGPDIFSAFTAACGVSIDTDFNAVVPENTLGRACSEDCLTYLVNLGACAATALKQEYELFLNGTFGLSPWSITPPQCFSAVTQRLSSK